jgi:hypothetical protein
MRRSRGEPGAGGSGKGNEKRAFGRLRSAVKRDQTVPNATAVIWKIVRMAEPTFRRLDAPELLD